ncbi:uncharacterized protein LOC143289814 isoform X1 [Babylonia areolata]|uniref:uncharacterized protein LOC143289814 isoform X1 n=1 Tax=Babylonia areolata TaxID=304850 RepID=UPI003FD15D7E
MSSPSDCSMGARIVFAVVGVVLGVCVAGVFGGVYHNFNAAAWGFVSATRVRVEVQGMPQTWTSVYRPPELGVEVSTSRPGLLPHLLIQGAVLENMGWGLFSLAAITYGCGCHSNPLQVCSEAAVSCAKAIDGSLVSPLQCPDGILVCLVASVQSDPASSEFGTFIICLN